mmetsp:Transcript_5975/g.7329  ORF Transcript_5975/g.7329 Transcript_5975/m.7329 type:complete len:624 (+) Transcript_5975:185-2056(+)
MTAIGTRSFSKMVSNNHWLVSCDGKHDKNSSNGGRWKGGDGEAARRKKLQNSITNRSSPLDNNKLAIQRTNTTSIASNEKKDDNSTKAKQKPQQQVNHQSKKEGGVRAVDSSISSTNKHIKNNVICNKNDCNDIDFSPHDEDYDTIIRIKSENIADDFVDIDDFLIDDDDNTNAMVAANLRESDVSLAAAETVTATKNITINRQCYQAEVDEWEFIAPPLQPPHSNCSRSTTTTPIAIGTHCKTHCLSPSCTPLSICQLYQITPTKLRQMNPSLLLLHSNNGEWGSGMVGTSLSGGRSSPTSCREEKIGLKDQCCCATAMSSSSASLEKQQQPKALLIPISEKCNKDQLYYNKQQPLLPKSKNKQKSVSCTVAMATTVYKQQHDIANRQNAICTTNEDGLIQLFQKGISSSFLELSSESNAGCCPHCILSFFQQKRIADLYLNIAADLLRDDNNNIKNNCVVKDAIKNALHDVNWEMQQQPQPTKEGFVRLLHKKKNHSKLLVQTPEITSNEWSIIERNNSKNGNDDEFSTDDVLVQKPSTLDCRIVHLKAAAASAFFNQSRSNNNNKLLVPTAEQMYSSPMMMNDDHTNTAQINYNHLKQQQQQLHQQPTLQHGVEMITLTE